MVVMSLVTAITIGCDPEVPAVSVWPLSEAEAAAALSDAEHPASMTAAAAHIIFLNFISFSPPVQHFIEDLDEIPEKKIPEESSPGTH